MKERINIEIGYHENQEAIFFGSEARYKIIAKGRRFGLTRGFAHYVIDCMLDGIGPVLWVDTIYQNIKRYYDRYFAPILKQLPRDFWSYNRTDNILLIGESYCDFRSADKPENIEGFGYQLIILNEAGIILKNERLWNESIRPMTLDYKANVLIGGTPKGKKIKNGEPHLFYELFEKGTPSPKSSPLIKGRTFKSDWKSFNYSTYDNPLLDKKEIDQLANDISPVLRDQEIYGKFVDTMNDVIVKREWWDYFHGNEYESERIIGRVQSWDTAFKKNEENDFSVCTTWIITNRAYYIIDMYRARLEFPELKRKAIELFDLYKPNEIWIEDKASGQSLIQELQRKTRIPLRAIKAEKDKITKVHIVTPIIENKKVLLPYEAKWKEILIREFEEFPNGQFDDIVDSVSQMLVEAKGRFSISEEKEKVLHVKRKSIVRKKQREVKR